MAGVGLEVLESVTEDVERVSSPREGSDSARVQGLDTLEVGGTDSSDQCTGSSTDEVKCGTYPAICMKAETEERERVRSRETVARRSTED